MYIIIIGIQNCWRTGGFLIKKKNCTRNGTPHAHESQCPAVSEDCSELCGAESHLVKKFPAFYGISVPCS